MNCLKCYQEIPDGTKFCPYCGAQQTETAEGAEPTILVQPKDAPTEDAPTEPIQTEEVPTEPEQPETSVGSVQTEEVVTEPTQPESASGENTQPGYTAGHSNFYYGSDQASSNDTSGQAYSNQAASHQYSGECQTPPSYQNPPQAPINWVPYLVLSIICTLCCCLPFGIVGIVYASKINTAMSAGNYEEAQKSAKTAKIWIIAAAATGAVVQILYIVSLIFGGMSGYYYY